MKKMFLVLSIVLSLALAGNVMAVEQGPSGFYEKQNGSNAGKIKYFSKGHPDNQSEWVLVKEIIIPCGGSCDDVTASVGVDADVPFGVRIHGFVNAPDNTFMNGGSAVGNFDMDGMAIASGKQLA